MTKEQEFCPRCGRPGYGPYLKRTRNRPGGNEYHKYAYFAHEVEKPDGSTKRKWCYLGVPQPKEPTEELPNHREKAPGRLPNPAPRAKGRRSRLEKGCRRCKHFTTLDARPFCKWLQSFLAIETFNQPCIGFEEE